MYIFMLSNGMLDAIKTTIQLDPSKEPNQRSRTQRTKNADPDLKDKAFMSLACCHFDELCACVHNAAI